MTNSQFECDPAPRPPEIGSKSDQALALHLDRLDARGWDCADQLLEIKNVLEVNGMVITDTIVTAEKTP